MALGGQGGAGVAFLQPKPYYCGRDVMVLTPRHPMTTREILWWATCITANRFRFGFGRQANRTLKDIELPPQKDMSPWVPHVDPNAAFVQVLDGLKEQAANTAVATSPPHQAQYVRLEEIFDVAYGSNLELNRLCEDADGINFVSRSAVNNGVTARVKPVAGLDPIPAGVLTVAGGGSVLETFLQPEPFYSGRDLYYLTPRSDMSLEEKMYYCFAIRANKHRYSYGRQANRTLKDLAIPARHAVPSWVQGSFARVTEQLKTLLPTL